MKLDQKQKIINKAKRKAKKLKKLREDQRYINVMGRLKFEGLLDIKNMVPRNYKLHLDDVLWVGDKIEPRVLELLPAILLKKPGMIYQQELPEDLRQAKNDLRQGVLKGMFRGLSIKSCDQWLTKTGRKGVRPSITKIFRLRKEDVDFLKRKSKREKISEAAVVRQALKALKDLEK